MRLLAASDLHLGRPPSRVPAAWAKAYSPRAALERLVDLAIRKRADAVLLAGDVSDRNDIFFEAHGALSAALARLREAGIPLVAVAGNHDTDLLPELADAIGDPEAFRLLGRGGTWEHTDLLDGEGGRARIVGWSFPEARTEEDPLGSFPGPGPDAPPLVVGLLHGDRDAAAGPYAPFSAAELERTGVALWLLGHIHLPDPVSAGARHLYLGSLQALDPTETGVHGALWIEGAGSVRTVERVRTGGLRYERVTLDASDFRGRADLLRALEAQVASFREADPALEVLGLRLRLAGESDVAPGVLREWLDEAGRAEEIALGGIRLRVEAMDVDVRPRLDLETLALGEDLVALLARTLVDLEGEAVGQLTRELLAVGGECLRDVDAAKVFAPLGTAEAGAATSEARDLLRRQGYALLRELHRQREGGDA